MFEILKFCEYELIADLNIFNMGIQFASLELIFLDCLRNISLIIHTMFNK